VSPVVTFFNNKGGVGKTSLVYHLAWMLAEQEYRVLVADFDPQANLTTAFFNERQLEEIWPNGDHDHTVAGAVQPLVRGLGDVTLPPLLKPITDQVHLLPGDLALARFEDELSAEWPGCLDGKERSFRVTTAFWRLLNSAARTSRTDITLVDVGPNLGAINRAALVASDHVVIPLAPDLFSFQGLRNLGPTLRDWRTQWSDRRARRPESLGAEELPQGSMEPLGYVVLQHSLRLDRPVKAYESWMKRIPGTFHSLVLTDSSPAPATVADDPWCIGTIKHYRSLVPMAQEARKPLFLLRSADGAIGAHQTAVQQAYDNFADIAHALVTRLGIGTA
jgi:chromosome partitioning protein